MHQTESAQAGGNIAPEDVMRAGAWRLLARFLSGPPDAEALAFAASLKGDDTAFGRAMSAFSAAAAAAAPERADDEYHALFIGVTRGEVVPHGSYYQTGFLNEKPLARLREDMARLGVARDAGASDPEDHVAALCDMMAGLILGEYAAPPCASVAREFFEAHLDSWIDVFFRDVEAAESAELYRPLAAMGLALAEIERRAFAMEARTH